MRRNAKQWAKHAFLMHCGRRSEVRVRGDIKRGTKLTLALAGVRITLEFSNGDYYVSGGSRGRILCGYSWETALGTFQQELARTLPA